MNHVNYISWWFITPCSPVEWNSEYWWVLIPVNISIHLGNSKHIEKVREGDWKSDKWIEIEVLKSEVLGPLWPPNSLGGKIWPQIWNQWPQVPTYPCAYCLYGVGPFGSLQGHYSLQTASDIKYDLRFEISDPNYLLIHVHIADMVCALMAASEATTASKQPQRSNLRASSSAFRTKDVSFSWKMVRWRFISIFSKTHSMMKPLCYCSWCQDFVGFTIQFVSI